jgi:tRNA modification GTPase
MQEDLHRIISGDGTIVAISTPMGRSGVGVVRMSGRDGIAIAQRFFKPHSSDSHLDHRTAVVGSWMNENGDEVDEVLVTLFRAPQSYTGEDVVEISGHGNPLTLACIVENARRAGARVAAPGEFTMRAVAHGKMDLIQAEAVREFIEAQTEQQAKTALRQMGGSVSKRIRPIKEKLLEVIARLEAGIDFAEDDVDVPDNSGIVEIIQPLAEALENLEETFGYGRVLIEGFRLAILGKPNVGKSSLFNRLVSTDRAIVTDIPGTTRDVLTETVSMEGIPLRFADTAGVRETLDPVESIGVNRALEALSDADLALVVLDGSGALDNDDLQVLGKVELIPHLVLINKSDLPQTLDTSSLDGSFKVHVSAKTGYGFDTLREAIRAFLLDRKTDFADDLVLTNSRQHEAIVKAISGLRVAGAALARNVPHEMALLDLYQGLTALDELTGDVVTDDILDRIFSTFCIGK